jgi:hypothetical protein
MQKNGNFVSKEILETKIGIHTCINFLVYEGLKSDFRKYTKSLKI